MHSNICGLPYPPLIQKKNWHTGFPYCVTYLLPIFMKNLSVYNKNPYSIE